MKSLVIVGGVVGVIANIIYIYIYKKGVIALNKSIKERRLQHNVTQMFLAKRVGVSINTIAKWENGVSTPSEDNAKRLEYVFSTLDRGGK